MHKLIKYDVVVTKNKKLSN